ncbi:MAG: hypothetical protein M3Z16_10660 [Pseudomonadota bacterium]|nr:hypothetical protein [Pseudomonadota bacterium]
MRTVASPAPVLALTVINSVVMVLALAAAAPATAGTSVLSSGDSSNPPACGDRQPLSGLDARVVTRAAQGVDSLRVFMTTTRAIYGLEMEATVAWLDRQRAAEAACNLAAANPSPRR